MRNFKPVLTSIVGATALALAGLAAAQAQTPAAPAAGGDAQMFPNAKPGECYARIFIPATYATETAEVVKQAASKKVKIIPAKYENVTETVVVKAASKKLELVPATFEWVEEAVTIRPASKRLITVPETYETQTEKVLVKAGYSTWKKGNGTAAGTGTTRVSASGDVMCLVEVPPEYKTVTKRVVKTPAATKEEEIPAVQKMMRRQVMKTPPTTREIEVPAVTQQITVSKLVEAAKEERIDIPAVTQTVSSTKQVTPGRTEWRPILCEVNATKQKIQAIQSALQAAGYNPGPIDGKIANQTMRAVNAYQRDKKLPVDPYLNLDTVRSLGVEI